ncbi:DEAD/DEAH box helicase, partial [Pseudomonas aeruginosa]|nr:DEAD/DEAH box helicase [Pseudomonas aeruginosa]
MNALTQPAALAASHLNINLTDFIDEFGDELLESLNRSNPPVYTGSVNAHRQLVMDRLKRKPFAAQAEVVQAITALLLDRNEQAGIINAEMGTGKTMMAIA